MKRTVSLIVIIWVLSLGIFVTGASFARYVEDASPYVTALSRDAHEAEPAYVSVIAYMRALERALRTVNDKTPERGRDEDRDLLAREEGPPSSRGMRGPLKRDARGREAEGLGRDDGEEERGPAADS